MRYLALAIALLLTACGDGPVTKARGAYTACLDARGIEGCQVEKAKLNSALAVADAQSRRRAAMPMPVLHTYQPPPQQPIYTPRVTCTTWGNITSCQ